MYSETLYGISIISGGVAYLLKYHKENNNVKRPECHQAQERVIDTFNIRINDLDNKMTERFQDLKDFILKK